MKMSVRQAMDLRDAMWRSRRECTPAPAKGGFSIPFGGIEIHVTMDDPVMTAKGVQVEAHGFAEFLVIPIVNRVARAVYMQHLLDTHGIRAGAIPTQAPAGRSAYLATRRALDKALQEEIDRTSLLKNAGADALGCSVTLTSRYSNGHQDWVMIDHPEFGTLNLRQGGMRLTTRAVKAIQRRSMNDMIGVAEQQRALPPIATANARLTRTIALLHDALSVDPDMTDDAGTLLRPLIETHIPELLRRHREATRLAQPEQLDALDCELNAGIDIVSRAVVEAIETHVDARGRLLAEQIRFLGARHPRLESPLGTDQGQRAA